MKLKGVGLSKRDNGQNLLMVTFEEGDEEKEWMPKWSDVCAIARNAVLTEAINSHGQWNEHMGKFLETANFIRSVCFYVEATSGPDLR